MTRCPGPDPPRPLKKNEAVANLGVVMPRHALSRRKGQHLHTQIGTLGYQLAASDRIIAAAAGLHRSVLPDPDTLQKTSRLATIFVHSRWPWQQGFACIKPT